MVAASFEAMRPSENLSVTEWAEKYHIIRQAGSHNGPWSRAKTPYLVEPQDILTSLDHEAMIFVGPARTGKALALDTPIATPIGWCQMGDLKVGDFVYDETGAPTRVIACSPVMHNHQCYRVTFDDGDSVVADAGHLWFVHDIWGAKHAPWAERVYTTDHIAQNHAIRTKRGQRSRYAIPMAKPLQAPHAELPLDPYVLGVWLGDGCNHHGLLTLRDDDVAPIVARFACNGFTPRRIRPVKDAKAVVVAVVDAQGRSLRTILHDMGLGVRAGGRYIPDVYLRASEQQRRELLRGLLDSDGHASAAQCEVEFSSSHPRLMSGYVKLLKSLGIKHGLPATKIPEFVHNRERRRGLPSQRVTFTTYEPDSVFSLVRQIEKIASQKTKPKPGQIGRRWIRSVEPVESVPVRCIQVESESHLFLAGEGMIPTHNSLMLTNWVGYSADVDPADTMVVHMAQHTAREWVKSDLEKSIRNSSRLREKLTPGAVNDNIYDKSFLSGMRLTVTWPTIRNLSGKTVPRKWLMDLDRMDDNVDKEGSPFELTHKRGTTFGRFQMTAAESSPGREVTDPRWLPRTPHEAPPTSGILGLYNLGDRRRWNWPCPHCAEAFEPDFPLLSWPESDEISESAAGVYMVCPHCGGVIEPREKERLNSKGRWVRDGMVWVPTRDTIEVREGMRPAGGTIASFWLKGPAAGYQSWQSLVTNYLRALRAYEETGDEEKLRVTVNTDQGHPYTPQSRISDRLPEVLRERAEDWGSTKGNPTVPPDVRFLIATVDVQAKSFVVQVHGFNSNRDMFIVDYFKIRLSERPDGDGRSLPIEPPTFAEDWEVLVHQVMMRTYELADGSGRRMPIKLTACDSGGAAGSTTNAYRLWQKLKRPPEEMGWPEGLHRRFILVKGNSSVQAARAYVSWPDSNKSGRTALAKGDIPVLMLGSNLLKDAVAGMLNRRSAKVAEPGGMIRYPSWTEDFIYTQLTNEVRTIKGWDNPAKRRNEAWDLCYYAYGVAIRPYDQYAPWPVIGLEKLDFSSPPSWAEEWDNNLDIIVPPGADQPAPRPGKYDFKSLGQKLSD